VYRRTSTHLLRNALGRRIISGTSATIDDMEWLLVYDVFPYIRETWTPAELLEDTEELTAGQRYNPELQRRSLANRQERQEDFDAFVTRLKQYSKSDKPSMSLVCSFPHISRSPSKPSPRHLALISLLLPASALLISRSRASTPSLPHHNKTPRAKQSTQSRKTKH